MTDDLTPTLTVGAILGFVVGWLMLRGHIPFPSSLNWSDTAMPMPGVFLHDFYHPRYGWVAGHRVKYCESDQEIVKAITDDAPRHWRVPDQAKEKHRD